MNHAELINTLKRTLEEMGHTVSEFADPQLLLNIRGEIVSRLGNYEMIWQFTSASPNVTMIFFFKDHNLYVGLDGTEDSWFSASDIEWRDFYPAEPYQVTETKYRRIE